MSAQIIPFPRGRAQRTLAAPTDLDPAFRAWCDRENQRAAELDQPMPLRSELRARYVCQSRLVSAERTSPRKEDHVRPTRELFALKPRDCAAPAAERMLKPCSTATNSNAVLPGLVSWHPRRTQPTTEGDTNEGMGY